MSPRQGNSPRDESQEERELRSGLRVRSLSPEALERIRSAAEAEWRANIERPRPWLSYAAAACILALTVFGTWLVLAPRVGPDHGEAAAHLMRFESSGVVELHLLSSNTALADGAALRAGHTYRVGGQALIGLEGGGHLRVAAGSELEILARDDVRLERGEMYVDIPPGVRSGSAFTARTSAGEFRHVGTQFALAVVQGVTRLRVREGSVQWVTADSGSTVQAGTEVVFANGAKASERPFGTSAGEWDWTAATTPDFEIDNRPLGEFLEWVARESGRQLVVSDDQARKQVATIRMHGSVHGLTPMQALSAVMSTTELRYDLPNGQIRVSSASETTQRK